MTARTRFVNVPAAELLGAIIGWGQAVAVRGGRFGELGDRRRGYEVAFLMQPPGCQAEIHILTSVARGEAEARACGEDAVRIVVGVRTKAGEWRNVRKPQKVLRTAPRGDEAARVAAFIERLRLAVRAAYGHVQDLPHCPDCGACMSHRLGSRGFFWGCVEYPSCRGTREAPTQMQVTISAGGKSFSKPKILLTRASRRAARDLAEHLDGVAEKHHGPGALEVLADRGPLDIDPGAFDDFEYQRRHDLTH